MTLSGTAWAARLCSVAHGEPVWLTLRSLRGDWATEARTVYVCENPTVVEAAADALGLACPPLVCTDGIAAGAAIELIAGLARHHCDLRIRADIDFAGFTIIEQILAVAPAAQLWRFDLPTYAETLGVQLSENPPPTSVAGTVEALRNVYDASRKSVHEERILNTLLNDLASENATDSSGSTQ